jgi:tetratricopeptide (TPR) repeat protein
LASALGTLELKAGNDKRARRLFRQALREPTENSLAQAEWASNRISGLTIEPQDLGEPNAFEARARSGMETGVWEDVIDESWRWHDDQPFDSNATMMGSYAAAVGLEDYEECVRLARAGLVANPGDAMLRNNLAFGLLQLGEVEQAHRALTERPIQGADEEERATHLATLGLLDYRLGNIERGRELYRRAIAMARGDPDLQALAAIMMAREELRLGTSGAYAAISDAFRLSSESDARAVNLWRDRLNRLAKDGMPQGRK